MAPRDSQRAKVYRAQEQLPKGKHLKTMAEMQAYVDKIHSTRWFQKRWPRLYNIEVRDGRGRRSACAGWGQIKMPKWSRYEVYILHEIAHLLTKEKHYSVPSHGREFVKNFIALLEWKMKINPRSVFREYRVKWHSKRRNQCLQNENYN